MEYVMLDSDSVNDKKTHCSLADMISFVGSIPVLWMSKHLGAIYSSTYTEEFSTIHTVAEEDISLRYTIHCLECDIPSEGSYPTKIFKDNDSVIINSQNPSDDLSKKHEAISYQIMRDTVAARIIEFYWLKWKCDISYVMTTYILKSELRNHCNFICW